jgi:predicted lipoprotein
MKTATLSFAFRHIPYRWLPLLLLLGLISCTDDGSDVMKPGFDRAALLTSLANDLIVPNFQALQASVQELAMAAEDFTQNTTEANLLALRAAWEQAALDQQHCSAFGFGPANLLLGPFTEVLAVFPANEAEIEQNMHNPDFDLANSFDRDIRGFYAIEYLIYGAGGELADLLAGFDQSRKHYLLLLVDELETTCNRIVTSWQTDYLRTFIANDGTAAGSSISLLYNAFVKDYENLKNYKLELPAGLTAGQAGPEPDLVEAYYSGLSRTLLVAHFNSVKNIWEGLSRDEAELIGFRDWLEALVGGPELVMQTREAIQQIEQALAALPDRPLSEQADSPALSNLRDYLQANTANFKSSMSSLLGISITFNSGDGD